VWRHMLLGFFLFFFKVLSFKTCRRRSILEYSLRISRTTVQSVECKRLSRWLIEEVAVDQLKFSFLLYPCLFVSLTTPTTTTESTKKTTALFSAGCDKRLYWRIEGWCRCFGGPSQGLLFVEVEVRCPLP
jgi:hypothetical protein